MRIKKGDLVKVIIGKESGKTGLVVNINKPKGLVIVKGLNIAKRHYKPSNQKPKGGIEEINLPFKSSNIMVICNHCQKPTRIGYLMGKNSKDRICKKCQEVIEIRKEEK